MEARADTEPPPEGNAPSGAPEAERPAAAGSDDTATARQAGRGGLAIAFGKVYFMVQGLLQQILLPRVLGLDGYGALSSVLSPASIAYNPIVATSIQGTSRAVAQSPDAERPVATRRTLVLQSSVTAVYALAFFLLAGPIADFMNAPYLVPSLRIVSGVLFFYGLYSSLVGVLNGEKLFLRQAAFDIVYATLRTGGLVAGGWFFATRFGLGVEGATVGFVATAACIFVAALVVVGTGRSGRGGPTAREHLVFIAPLFVGQTLLNLLLQADLTLLRRFAGASAVAAGLARTDADPLVGAYRATQLYCFLPYQLLLSVVFVLFPMLATAYRDRDREAVARYVRTGVRLALVIAGAMVSVTSGLSASLIRLVFPEEAAQLGARSMQVLSVGFGAFALFAVLVTVLNSLKRERISAFITALAFFLVVTLCYVRVRGTPFGEELLWQTATSTSAGLFAATAVAVFAVRQVAGAVVAPLTVVRVLGCLGVAILVGRALPEGGKLLTVVESAVVGLVYLVLLALIREIGRADLERLRAVVGRR